MADILTGSADHFGQDRSADSPSVRRNDTSGPPKDPVSLQRELRGSKATATRDERQTEMMVAQAAEVQAFLKEQASEASRNAAKDAIVKSLTFSPRTLLRQIRDEAEFEGDPSQFELERYPLLGELTRLGVTDGTSVLLWKYILQNCEALSSQLTSHEKLDVLLSAVLVSLEVRDNGHCVNLVLPAFTDETRLVQQEVGNRVVPAIEVLCRWYASLKYPARATPLLTKLQFGEWPCSHGLLSRFTNAGLKSPKRFAGWLHRPRYAHVATIAWMASRASPS